MFIMSDVEFIEFEFCFEFWSLHPDRDLGMDREHVVGPQTDNFEDLHLKELMAQRPVEQLQSVLKHNREIQYVSTNYRSYLDAPKTEEDDGEPKEDTDVVVQDRALQLRATREKVREAGKTARLDAMSSGLFAKQGMNKNEKRDMLLSSTRDNLLRMITRRHMSQLTRCAFPSAAEPTMRLDFGKNDSVVIQFFDDTGREHWRKALACVLNSSD